MYSESLASSTNSGQESMSNIGENNLDNYLGGNEFHHAAPLITMENNNINLNDYSSNNNVENSDEEMNYIKSFNINENESVESLIIDNREDILSYLETFKNNQIKMEDKEESINEAKEKIESSEYKENDKFKKDEKKIVFEILKTAREEKNKSIQYGRKKRNE